MKWLVTVLLDWLLAKVWPRIKEAALEFIDKQKRAKDQEEKQKKVEEDVQAEKPRDEETRRNEEDYLNS